jgi:hypothetical protein
MGFLRRMLGGSKDDEADPGSAHADQSAAPGAAEMDEIERDRALLREEALRLDDDLIQRQLRYANRSWTPPAQGGTKRAEDGDRPAE